MEISTIVVGIFSFLICAGILSRLALIMLSRKLRKKFGIQFGVGSFGFFVLKDVWIAKNEKVIIRMKSIALVSRLLHREYLKPLSIVISKFDVCLDEVGEYPREIAEQKRTADSSKKSPQSGMVLYSILYISQYVGVIIPELNLTVSKKDLKAVMRSRISLKVEGQKFEENERTFNWSVNADETTVKVFEESKPVMECSMFLLVRASGKPATISQPMDLHVKLTRLTLIFKEGLIKRILKQRNERVTESYISKDSVRPAESSTMLEKLPRNAVLCMEDCKIAYVSARGREIYLSWHSEVAWKSNFAKISVDRPQWSYELSVDLTGLVVNSSCNKLLLNKQIECSVKITPNGANQDCSIALNLDTFHSSVIEEELEFWIEETRNCLSLTSPVIRVQTAHKPTSNASKIHDMLLNRWLIKVVVQNCSCDVMGTCMTTGQYYPILNAYLRQLDINVSGSKQEAAKFTSVNASITMSDLYTYLSQVNSKVEHKLLEVGADKPAIQPSTESHIWGRIIELGKITVEVSSDNVIFDGSVPLVLTASAQISYLACEASQAVTLRIKDLYSILCKLGFVDHNKLETSKQRNITVDTKGAFKVHLDVEMRVANVNLFLMGERENGWNSLQMKMDHVDVSTGSKDEPMLWEINNLKLCRLCGITKSQPYRCFEIELSQPFLLYIPLVSTCFFRKIQPKSLTVSIQDCSFGWDTTKHMVIHEQLNNFMEAKAVLTDLFEQETRSSSQEKPLKMKMELKLDLINADLTMKTSKEHSFSMKMDNFSLHSSNTETCVKSSEVDILFDQRPIFKLQEAEITKVPGERFRNRREKYTEISPSNDNALCIEMEKFQSMFPYKFDFASSLESLLNVFKMLKKLHIKPKPADYEAPLPPDLHILCSVLTFELEDDPFEVKLEQNYLLQLDEMEECVERERKLKERLKDIQGAFVSSKKMEDIMRNLAAKNAQIYIKRSMAIHQDNMKRSTLFRCAVHDLDLMILADSNFNNKENVVGKLKDIDNTSPFPENMEFSTLWCRCVDGGMKYLTMYIRDYQQPLVLMDSFNVSGILIGAEQTGADISRREGIVEIDEPWDDMVVSKNMPSLKFYHDLKWDLDVLEIGWGINFEPALSTVSLGFDLLSKASVDPSKPLPFWDKMRLLFHGRLKMNIKELDVVLSASRDPNNTTEKMVIVWEEFVLDWTNACFVINGNFDLHIRTASKYDDSRVLHFPGFEVRFDLQWLCRGDPNDHHRAIPRNPAKIINIESHDSYKNFRSHNLNLSIQLETGKDFGKEELKANTPTLFLYASTLRWLQKYQAVVLRSVSRPIRRGSYFGNVKPRKPTLGRHYKFLDINFIFNRLCVNYFGSFTKDAGLEMVVSSGSFGANYEVDVQQVHDDLNLTRRPVANWILCGLQSELDKVSTDLLSNLPETGELTQIEIEDDIIDIEQKPKSYFLFSVKRVVYRRKLPGSDMSSYIHKVQLNDFRGAWTAFNRKITFELFEAYENMQMLKRVLSSEALKLNKDSTSQDFRRQHKDSIIDLATSNSKTNPVHDDRLLQQLVSEQQSKFLAKVEEGDNESEGPNSAEVDDVIQLNWHIELVNSQVILIGRESKGALLITASNANIMKRLHRPVDTNNDVILKLNKVTWSGELKNLQCFATAMSMTDLSSTSIPWINSSVICGVKSSNDSENQSNVASFMKSSYCVGSIVNVSFGGSTVELQRVVSPSLCEFNYVSLDPELDPFAEEFEATQSMSSLQGAAFGQQVNLANTLLIRHPTLEISTSPDQYALIMEICQTLLLYTEPKKREKEDRFEKMKFRMQLSAGEDTKGDIQELQNCVRDSLSYLRRCERQLFEYRRSADSSPSYEDDSSHNIAIELKEAIVDLQDQVNVTKEQINVDSEELKMMIRIFKDFSLNTTSPSPTKGRSKNYIVKQSDIIFDDMRWRLTQQDGQLGIADVQFKKFHYNKLTFNDNGVEHRLELGGFAVHNLIPNEPYRELLVPHEINVRRHVDKSVFVRVYCRVQSPVAGISVREHFEVNVCPIAVRLTHRFYHYVTSFFFSRKIEKVDVIEGPEIDAGSKGKDETEESQREQTQTTPAFKKPAPPRPPPPKLMQMPKQQQLPVASPVKQPHMLQPTYLDLQAEERLKKKPGLTLSLQSHKESAGTPVPSPVSSAVTPTRTPSVKRSASFYSGFSTDKNVDKMKQRAARNQTFIYIKIPEIPICFSYKGEKDRNIEDAHDFNLRLPTLEYHSKTWTWQDLSMAMKKDYTQVLVPQIIKEKLHLKGDLDNKKCLAEVGDEDKAKLLLGDLPGTQKKTGKKLLFGKLTSLMTKGNSDREGIAKGPNNEKSAAELSGKGIDPLALKDKFDRLRAVSTENIDENKFSCNTPSRGSTHSAKTLLNHAMACEREHSRQMFETSEEVGFLPSLLTNQHVRWA